MRIPALNMKAPYEELKEELDAAYHRFMESGWYVLGEETAAFESEFADYCGVKYCIGVSNGLEALHLTLKACGVSEGDEVIVPSNTYIATWLAVSHCGAIPVPVEPDANTYNIDPNKIEAAINEQTKVIVPVHLYGQPADMDPIMEIAEHYGIKVVEDNAQAQGALYKGHRTGGLSHAAGNSFYPGKNLGAFGEAGAVTTNNETIANKIRSLRNYGSQKKYHNEVKGFNSRIDELQAAFLRVKLRHLDVWNERRGERANQYIEGLQNLANIILPYVLDWTDPVWHQFTIRLSGRDKVQQQLISAGIASLIHYPVPPHLSQAYVRDCNWEELRITEDISETILSLPMGPHISSAEVAAVIDSLKEIMS